jgi:tetratricopeptide (TPR) repeat protein
VPVAKVAWWRPLVASLIALVLMGATFWGVLRLKTRADRDAAALRATPTPLRDEPRGLPPPGVVLGLPVRSAAPTGSAATPGLSAEDLRVAQDIHGRLNGALSEADATQAEELARRYPGEANLRALAAAVLVGLAEADQRARRFEAAAARIERAARVAPGDVRIDIAQLNLALAQGDWTRAEGFARRVYERDSQSADAQYTLAYVLFRLDRNRDAAELLRALQARGEHAEARALLERIERTRADERGMTEQHLARFNVRYDGDAHEDVGREILRALERHYATLVSTLDHTPSTVIPVILFSQQDYHTKIGQPLWAGGHYDTLDGRIRVPIGGLGTALTPELDGTLIHELCHAFVADRTRGNAPRDLHEGLAQYVEGKRLEMLLDPEDLKALAAGRFGGVGGFYLEALGWVEYLMTQRGQGGLNELLRALAETSDVDEAFERVYGRDAEESRRAFRQRLKQQTGSD